MLSLCGDFQIVLLCDNNREKHRGWLKLHKLAPDDITDTRWQQPNTGLYWPHFCTISGCSNTKTVLFISVNKLVDVTKQLVELRHVKIIFIECNVRLNPHEQRRYYELTESKFNYIFLIITN